MDLAVIEATVYKNDKLLSQGSGKDAVDNPLNQVAWLASGLESTE